MAIARGIHPGFDKYLKEMIALNQRSATEEELKSIGINILLSNTFSYTLSGYGSRGGDIHYPGRSLRFAPGYCREDFQPSPELRLPGVAQIEALPG